MGVGPAAGRRRPPRYGCWQRISCAIPISRSPDRARTFLDSCAFSAEVAGGDDVAAVNLFARSDPTGGSWPYLLWRDKARVRQQALEAGGMRLFDLQAPDEPAAADTGAALPPHLAGIFGRTGSRGQSPVVLVWQKAPVRARGACHRRWAPTRSAASARRSSSPGRAEASR
jgi:hypothetical protein